MIRALRTAASGMKAQETRVDVIANNLANVNTAGFKKTQAQFQDLLYQTLRPAGVSEFQGQYVPGEMQVGHGVKLASTQKIFTQGNFTQTENQLDLAIEGRGFFKIMKGTEEVYTRDGSFKLNEEGYIVDSQGNRLQPEIAIPVTASTITIDSGGSLTALDENGAVVATGQINTYDFVNPAGLLSDGNNYFTATEASGDAVEGTPGVDGLGTVLQGSLESSNISVVEEMVNMIVGQRAYEANSKIIKTSDDMLQIANNVKA